MRLGGVLVGALCHFHLLFNLLHNQIEQFIFKILSIYFNDVFILMVNNYFLLLSAVNVLLKIKPVIAQEFLDFDLDLRNTGLCFRGVHHNAAQFRGVEVGRCIDNGRIHIMQFLIG